MYSLDECARLWDEVGQHGGKASRIERSRSWLPYYAYLAEPMKTAPFSLENASDSAPAHLLREGLVGSTDTVLDIGAGMGGDSLIFASHGAHVTAMEPSAGCLDVLRRRAQRLAIHNIETVQTFWEDFDRQETFDVCYSSMCPAICNIDELRRMEQLSRRLCCLVTVARGSYDRHRKAMMAELGIQPKGGMVTEAIHYYNALYLMGRQVNVLCRSFHHETAIPRERILEQYPIYFRIFGVEAERSVPFLKDYLARNAPDGLLREESHINLAMLIWNVN